ncbi:hypothetical protein E4N77_00175 [Treponema denticola]|nr:hypothetical protein E4N77_00175 [Treponema denticola]
MLTHFIAFVHQKMPNFKNKLVTLFLAVGDVNPQ